MQSAAVQWSQLLIEAVQKPGIISTAYTAFHNYSIGNQILAWSQCQDRELPVGPIATFKKWKSLGRSVVKGAKAIHLCMPITIKKEKHGQDEIFQTFVLKNYWFVLSQTEGQPYQERTVNTDWSAKLALAQLQIEERPFESTDGNCQGYAVGRNVSINPVAALPHKTLFHEIAHVVLGHTAESTMTDSERTPKSIREVEAESVALICCAVCHLPGQDEARGYIQHWLQGNDIPNKSAQKILVLPTAS